MSIFNFLIFNAIVVLISVLFVISKGRKVSKNIFTILLFSTLIYFIVGKGVLEYITLEHYKESVYYVPFEEVKVDAEYIVKHEENAYINGIHLSEIEVELSDTLTEPTLVLDLEEVNSWIIRLLLDKEKIEPTVKLFVPLNEVYNIDKIIEKQFHNPRLQSMGRR